MALQYSFRLVSSHHSWPLTDALRQWCPRQQPVSQGLIMWCHTQGEEISPDVLCDLLPAQSWI